MSDFRAISRLAYELWEKSGRREGMAEQNWLEAERILASRGRAPLSGQAVDTLLTAPSAARGRKATAKRATKVSRKGAPVKMPNPPEDEVDRLPSETPKVSSRDAPGG
jgi:Protein of unknown function (DUF2934)